jgi:hypothetical protein
MQWDELDRVRPPSTFTAGFRGPNVVGPIDKWDDERVNPPFNG